MVPHQPANAVIALGDNVGCSALHSSTTPKKQKTQPQFPIQAVDRFWVEIIFAHRYDMNDVFDQVSTSLMVASCTAYLLTFRSHGGTLPHTLSPARKQRVVCPPDTSAYNGLDMYDKQSRHPRNNPLKLFFDFFYALT